MTHSTALLFDRALLRARRERAASHFHTVNFMKKEACVRLVECLEVMTHSFPLAVELGAHQGELADMLADHPKIETLIQTDLSLNMLQRSKEKRLVCDEEWLPFADQSVDAVLSAMSLHWVNDLPGCLVQIQRALKPDGLFLAVLPGAQTLKELRHVWDEVSAELQGGVSPHISPFVDVRDAGNLLSRAGFALPVVDSEFVTITYEHPFKLMHELRLMGETNALLKRHHTFTPRQVMMEVAQRYQERYQDGEGRIPVTVELVTLTAWKPHGSQQQPAKRGSGQVSLTEVLSKKI